jgi:hypothetical protein
MLMLFSALSPSCCFARRYESYACTKMIAQQQHWQLVLLEPTAGLDTKSVLFTGVINLACFKPNLRELLGSENMDNPTDPIYADAENILTAVT